MHLRRAPAGAAGRTEEGTARHHMRQRGMSKEAAAPVPPARGSSARRPLRGAAARRPDRFSTNLSATAVRAGRRARGRAAVPGAGEPGRDHDDARPPRRRRRPSHFEKTLSSGGPRYRFPAACEAPVANIVTSASPDVSETGAQLGDEDSGPLLSVTEMPLGGAPASSPEEAGEAVIAGLVSEARPSIARAASSSRRAALRRPLGERSCIELLHRVHRWPVLHHRSGWRHRTGGGRARLEQSYVYR